MAVTEKDTLKSQLKRTGPLGAVDDAVTLDRFLTWGAVGLQLTGTWVGTVQFEITIDGTTWTSVSLTPSNSVTTATSATANGAWYLANNFFAGIRARCSAFTSGTITVTLLARPSQF